MLKQKTQNQDEVSALLSTYEVFSTASRQRIIEVEKSVQSLSETQSEDILPKLEEIGQLRKLCEEINTYNQEEMDKVTHHEPLSSTTNLPLGINTQTFDTEHDRSKDEKDDKEPLELLVIGSSITKFIDARKIEKKADKEAMTICMRGAKVEHVHTKISEVN